MFKKKMGEFDALLIKPCNSIHTFFMRYPIDVLFLDMPNPCEVLEKDLSGVKRGGYIVCYVPSISQIQEITKLVEKDDGLYFEEISEVILRHWRVWDRVSRPERGLSAAPKPLSPAFLPSYGRAWPIPSLALYGPAARRDGSHSRDDG